MSSVRAAEVAEILWELKRAGKIATYTLIAQRAGFSAGSNGRAMKTCLKNVRRDWPHLQWWRAIADDYQFEKGSEQETFLVEAGFELETATESDDAVTIKAIDEHIMSWDEAEAEAEETV